MSEQNKALEPQPQIRLSPDTMNALGAIDNAIGLAPLTRQQNTQLADAFRLIISKLERGEKVEADLATFQKEIETLRGELKTIASRQLATEVVNEALAASEKASKAA